MSDEKNEDSLTGAPVGSDGSSDGKRSGKPRKVAPVKAEGHRQRMFDELKNNGPRGISDRKLLEMLLFFSIPRADTRDTAIGLIERFGSLENVFRASLDELEFSDGVGPKSAMLISIVGELFVRTAKEKKLPKRSYKNDRALAGFFRTVIPDDGKEYFVIAFLDDERHVIKHAMFTNDLGGMVSLDRQKVLTLPAWGRAAFIAIAHNHPGGSLEPSSNDENLTILFKQFAGERGVGFIGHLLIAGDGFVCV